MAKAGRNDPCPCGSGKKYKQCCLPKEEATALEVHTKAQAEREARAAANRERERQREAERLAVLAAGDIGDDPLDAASNAVVDLVHAGKLEEAEAAARDLLVSYPEVHDGWDRLGMVYEARGNGREAADCYRKVIDFLRQNPDYADPEMAESYAKLIAKLDPPPAG